MLYLERWYKTMSPTGDFQWAIAIANKEKSNNSMQLLIFQ